MTAWISGTLSRVGGTTYTRILLTVMGLAAVVSAVITVNGAAAALLPVTVAVARRAGSDRPWSWCRSRSPAAQAQC